MKKAQTSEFIGIIVLIAIFVVLTILNSISEKGTGLRATEESLKERNYIYISMAMNTLPYITINGIPLEELFGYTVCYKTAKADYGAFTIDIENEVRDLFDEYFKNKWLLELDKFCFSPYFQKNKCKISGDYISYSFTVPLPCNSSYARGNLYVKK